MQQLTEVSKKIGDYKKDYPRFKIDPDADKVASALDPQSFAEMLDNLIGYDLPPCYQVLVPFGRYATSDQIHNLMSRMNKWKDWYMSPHPEEWRSWLLAVPLCLMILKMLHSMLKRTG